MNLVHYAALIFFFSSIAGGGSEPKKIANRVTRIDRQAVVTRHNIAWNSVKGQIPLGNGEFCFNADGTGLQTFGGNIMSHWGLHSFPLPAGVTSDQIPSTGTFQQGRNKGLDVFPKSSFAIRTWLYDNPHIINLARIRLVKSGGKAFARVKK